MKEKHTDDVAWEKIVDYLAESVFEKPYEELCKELRLTGEDPEKVAADFEQLLLSALDKATTKQHSSSEATVQSSMTGVSWIQLVKQKTGLKSTELAAKIPHTNLEFLTLVSRHPELAPLNVKEELSSNLEPHLSKSESMAALTSGISYKRAASSKKTPTPDPTNFEELLNVSGLTQKQKRYWLNRK